MDQKGEYFIISSADCCFRTYFRCPNECESCEFPNNCSIRQENFILDNGICINSSKKETTKSLSFCVHNIFQK